jgi:phosphoglycolate phosphatase
MPLFDGVEAVLRQLDQAGYLLAVATGKARRGLDRVLAETGLAGLFVATRCADECLSKPHPQMLLELMEFTGCEPEETLMIGDTEYDMAMAASAGVPAVAVSYGVHPCVRLLNHNPVACIHRIQELAGVLESRKDLTCS